MGYQRKSKTFKLVFDDEEFAGLEVRTRSVSLGQFLKMESLTTSELTEATIHELFKNFVQVLISWNLEDEDGVQVPTTLDGLYAQDLDFVQKVIEAWKEAMVGVSRPLEQSLPVGEPFPEVSIPMETLSASRAS